MFTLTIHNSKLLIISLFLSLVISFFSPVVFLFVAILLFIIVLFNLKGTNYLMIPIIIGYVSLTSEFFPNFRIISNSVFIILLFYLVLKRYEIRYSDAIKITKGLFIFFTLLFITLFISTAFSGNFTISFFASIRTGFFFILIYLFYLLTCTEADVEIIILSLILTMLFTGFPMLIDLYNMGIENYFIKILLRDKIAQYSSRGYTGVTIFFITSTLIVSLFFWEKLNNIRYKIALSILLFLNLIFLILANSRGGLTASLISIVFILTYLKRKLFVRYALIISFCLILLYLLIPSINDTVNFYMRWETVGDREEYWQMGLDVIKKNAFFGIGPDTFDKQFFNYATSKTYNYLRIANLDLGKPHPHNFFLYFTAENGILGLITSILFFSLIFYYSVKAIQLTKGKNNFYFVLSLAIFGITLGNFFRSFIEVEGFLTYGYITRDLPFWLIIVVLIRIYLLNKGDTYNLKILANK